MNYALDTGMAREGSGSLGGSIQETGAYTGKIEWAREGANTNNTKYVEIRFVDDSKQAATLTLYTYNNQNEQLAGLKKIHAIMACLKIRSMSAVQGSVEAYDYDTKQVTTQQSTILPELANKAIGFVLQKEFYLNNQGEQKYRMNLFASFTPDTRQVAREVLDNNGEAKTLDHIIENIKDRYSDNVKAIQAQAPAYQAPPQNPPMQGAPMGAPPISDFDDDIPFMRLDSYLA